MNRKFQLSVFFLICAVYGISQPNYYFVEGQSIDSLPQNVHWYAVSSDNSINICSPEIQRITDKQSGAEKNILYSNDNSVLIIGSKEKLINRGGMEIPFKDKIFSPNSKLILNSNEILFAHSIKAENEEDEIYRLIVYYKDSSEESVIFRNCKQPKTSKNYFGCGRIPFIIGFYGDLTNDGFPEILLAAEKEDNVLKILIGKEDGVYKVLYHYESE